MSDPETKAPEPVRRSSIKVERRGGEFYRLDPDPRDPSQSFRSRISMGAFRFYVDTGAEDVTDKTQP